VRGGLLVAGVAIAVVGAGLMVSLFFLPGTPTDTRSASDSIADLGANSSRSWTIPEEVAVSGTLQLSWTTSGPANVYLSKTSTCPVGTGLCPVAPPIATWYGNLSGTWSLTGPVTAAYLLTVTNPGHTPISFSGTLTETYVVPTAAQAVPAWALILLGGLVLLGIGAIAVFLGLFLPPGVYRPPSPGMGRYDELGDDGLGDLGSDPRETGEL
jgi:hypothetical protein